MLTAGERPVRFLLRHWTGAAILVLWFTPTIAMAQSGSGNWYGSVSGSWVMPATFDTSTRIAGATQTSEMDMEAGLGALVAGGFEFESRLRGEIELGYRKLDIDKVTYPGGHSSDIDGDVSTISLMANGYYTFEVGPVRPYLGGGVGLARHKGTDATESPESSGKDTLLAYQGMAGVSLPLTETIEARLGYRYFATADAEFDEDLSDVEMSYATHSIEAGLLFRF